MAAKIQIAVSGIESQQAKHYRTGGTYKVLDQKKPCLHNVWPHTSCH